MSGKVVSILFQYLGGPGFGSRTGDQLSQLGLYVVILSLFRQH